MMEATKIMSEQALRFNDDIKKIWDEM